MNAFEIAQTYLGEKEVKGVLDNEKIIQMLKSIDSNVKHDETPWCSAFVNFIAKQTGALQSNSLMARSWLKVGNSVVLSEAIVGYDVVILKSPADPENTEYGHVGFYHSHTPTEIILLGGNQDDSVSLKSYPLELLLGIRRIKNLELLSAIDTDFNNYDLEINQTLEYGDRNTEVVKLQQALKNIGFYTDIIDGIFGKITKDAVERFQKSKNLSVDGVAGKDTFNALNENYDFVDEAWVKKALSMISFFETSSTNPFIAVTGNFDGHGISCGVLQWNIGSNSLQPLIKYLTKEVVLEKMPNYGELLWEICNSSVKRGLEIVNENFIDRNSTKKDVKKAVKLELQALLNIEESKNYQLAKVKSKAVAAKAMAKKWALDSRQSPFCTLQEFCWFFDLLTLNGSLKGLTYKDVANFSSDFNNTTEIFQHIFKWAEDYPIKVTESGEDIKTLWKSSVPDNVIIWNTIHKDEINTNLSILSFLRAKLSRPQFKLVTLSRKLTISLGKGKINGKEIDINTI